MAERPAFLYPEILPVSALKPRFVSIKCHSINPSKSKNSFDFSRLRNSILSFSNLKPNQNKKVCN